MLSGKDPVDGCGSYAGYMQMDVTFYPNDVCYYPQISAIHELHAFHADSIFILNLRPVDDWVRSVQRWSNSKGNLGDRMQKCFMWKGDNMSQSLSEFYVNKTCDKAS